LRQEILSPSSGAAVKTGERELVTMRWGIVPWFAKTEGEFKALSTINARSDRLTGDRMWREPFAKRRCLVPASGLYEWPKPGHAISPTYIPEPEQKWKYHRQRSQISSAR
jgi:putative SOS response-associated peptidase YedK